MIYPEVLPLGSTFWNEAFEALFFGSGAWLGILLFVTVVFLLSALNKWANVLCIPLSIFIGIWYLDNLEVSNNMMWGAICMLLSPVFLTVMLAEKKG